MPIDWINLSVRALALAALPLVAGLYGKLSSLLIYLLGVWLVFTILISLARRGGREPRWLEIVTIAFDIGFAVAAIRLSGVLDSPLWWSLLIGPLRAGLAFGLPSMLLTMGLGLALLAMVGVISGFFGMGGGWAAVPAMNLIMAVPVKVASACSGVLLGMGDCIAVWPYLLSGAILPLFVAPWLVGQVLGGLLGAHVLIRVKARFVRLLLIGIMFFTSFALVTKGLKTLGYMGEVPMPVFLGVFLIIMVAVVLAILDKLPKAKR